MNKLQQLKEYIENTVYQFQQRYNAALDRMGANRTPLYHEDHDLWEDIVSLAEDWCQDNDFNLSDADLNELLHGWYD